MQKGRKHLKFKYQELKNRKSRGNPVKCVQCSEGMAREQSIEDERRKQIRRLLSMKDAWKCTCKSSIHQEKCQLYPTHAGERRWPGKNKGVSESDLEFLAKRARHNK